MTNREPFKGLDYQGRHRDVPMPDLALRWVTCAVTVLFWVSLGWLLFT